MTAAAGQVAGEPWARHRLALWLRRRCGGCAERVEARALLRGQPCAHCGDRAGWGGGDVEGRIAVVSEPLQRRRWAIYGLVGLGAFLTGAVPFVAALGTLVALLLVRHTILKAAIVWLSPRRRTALRLLLRQGLALVAVCTLILDELLSLIPVAGWIAKIVVAVGATAVYVEGSFAVIRNRLRRDQVSASLDTWEWVVPVVLLVLLLAAAAGAVALVFVLEAAVGAAFDWAASMVGVG